MGKVLLIQTMIMMTQDDMINTYNGTNGNANYGSPAGRKN